VTEKLTPALRALLEDMGNRVDGLKNDDENSPMWWIEGGHAVRGNVAAVALRRGLITLSGKWGGQPGLLGFTRTDLGRKALEPNPHD